MAWNHSILLLFLLLVVSPISNGERYRVHSLRIHKINIHAPVTFGFLPKSLPVPPSAPSKRHNNHREREGPGSSAEDGGDREVHP
ncbi:hypothetical protein SADUNF_Sadunf13G0060600 [Salix dunnii]|uniref:Uncharacterized protein n=1 Tax=Salix dunnii TaxID=1413687 RepID=A0A835JL17_9ROSI|nr:hypothetical protein SADUNF_Sadunf13G0060600 [Salix dunnii]